MCDILKLKSLLDAGVMSKPKRMCEVEGCEKKHYINGYCKPHNYRVKRYGNPYSPTLKERFDRSYIPVPESGCWLWTAHVGKTGYGSICYKKKRTGSHRMSWMIHNGDIPEGLLVLHQCDTRSCVNPDHLFLGTYKDNAQDCIKKGRDNRLCGEDNHNSKLT